VSRARLLCLPCAGASALPYRRWQRFMPAGVEVVPLELPGRGSRLDEPYATDFDALIDELCAAAAPAMTGRFALFGHSMGGLLAYGMARALHRRARPAPACLLVAASPAPSRRASGGPERSEAELVADLAAKGGTPAQVLDSPELRQMALGTLAADYRLCARFAYRREPAMALPIHVFGGRGDDVDPGRLDAWREETAAAFTLDWFDGGHFFFRGREADFAMRLAAHVAA
jgi:surfactin synthase thioesterase subunit